MTVTSSISQRNAISGGVRPLVKGAAILKRGRNVKGVGIEDQKVAQRI